MPDSQARSNSAWSRVDSALATVDSVDPADADEVGWSDAAADAGFIEAGDAAV